MELQSVTVQAQRLRIALVELPVAESVDAGMREEDASLHPAHQQRSARKAHEPGGVCESNR